MVLREYISKAERFHNFRFEIPNSAFAVSFHSIGKGEKGEMGEMGVYLLYLDACLKDERFKSDEGSERAKELFLDYVASALALVGILENPPEFDEEAAMAWFERAGA